MHYTATPYRNTLNWFTLNTDKYLGNMSVSSHHIITQTEDNIPGGIPVKIVPEESRARNAGISNWNNSCNLNNTSVGIEHVNMVFSDKNGIR